MENVENHVPKSLNIATEERPCWFISGSCRSEMLIPLPLQLSLVNVDVEGLQIPGSGLVSALCIAKQAEGQSVGDLGLVSGSGED